MPELFGQGKFVKIFGGAMINCKTCKKWISSYIENELDTDKEYKFKEHIANCNNCKELTESIGKLPQQLSSLPQVHVSKDFDAVLRARLRLENKRKWSLFDNLPGMRIPALGTIGIAIIVLLTISILQFRNTNRQNPQYAQAHLEPHNVVNYVLDEIYAAHSPSISYQTNSSHYKTYIALTDTLNTSVDFKDQRPQLYLANQNQFIAF